MRAKQELSSMDGFVEIIDRALSSSEYYNLLFRADAVIIPYLHSGYYAQTSGIFAEAVALGRPVIVPQGTWMEREFEKYKSGGELFAIGDSASLGRALLKFAEHPDESYLRAHVCRKKWVQYHNPRNYVDVLLKIIGEGR